MTRDVIVAPPSLSVAHAWKILCNKRIRHLPVVSDGRLVGMLSDRDLLRLGHVSPSGELTFVNRCLGDIMTLDPIVCAPTDAVAELCRVMVERKIDSLPVVADGRLVGLVTTTDLLELLFDLEEVRMPFAFRIEVAAPL